MSSIVIEKRDDKLYSYTVEYIQSCESSLREAIVAAMERAKSFGIEDPTWSITGVETKDLKKLIGHGK